MRQVPWVSQRFRRPVCATENGGSVSQNGFATLISKLRFAKPT